MDTTLFGPFELGRRLGVGGMAETFVARRQGVAGFEQRLCLKRILPAFSDDAEFNRLFQSEAKLAAKLRHQAIVQVYDFGEEKNVYWMALELVEGADLRTVMNGLKRAGERMPYEIVTFLAIEMIGALDYAHTRKIGGKPAAIVHRDVSPSNILISYAGEVKLADFGIAKAATQTHITRAGTIKGKIPYMAPEQASGTPLDGRADLFSLGVVLYEIIAQRRPFDGSTELETFSNIIQGKHQPILEAFPDVPVALANAIERLIAHDREARFATGAEALDAFAEAPSVPNARRQLGAILSRVRPAPEHDSFAPPARESARPAVALAPTALPTTEIISEPAESSVDQKTQNLPQNTAIPPSSEPTTLLLAERLQESAEPATTTDVSTLEHDRPHPLADDAATIPLATTTKSLSDISAPIPLSPPKVVVPVGEQRGEVQAVGFPHSKPFWPLFVIGGASIVGMVIAAVVFLVMSRPKATAPAAAKSVVAASSALAAPPVVPAAPTVAQVAVPSPSPATSPATEAAAAPATTAIEPAAPAPLADIAAAPEEGTLRITAIPWGEIWIDGHHVGSGTARKKVRAGHHVVAVGLEKPVQAQNVELSPREDRSITIRVQ